MRHKRCANATSGLNGSHGWLVDAHVHLHECFDVSEFFAGAVGHFDAAARKLGLAASTGGCLLLVELASQSRFRGLRDAGLEAESGWTIRAVDESNSVVAEHRDGGRLVIIAGRQVSADNGLEVLAIGSEEAPRDGLPIERVLESVSRAGALPIIPWGFGKWWFRRGSLVERLLRRPPVPTLLVGDSGGRWRRGRTPEVLRAAEACGIWNLPGSDPLPLPWQAGRAGSYGFFLRCEPDWVKPASQLQRLVREATSQPVVFGERESLVRFARAQLEIRMPGHEC